MIERRGFLKVLGAIAASTGIIHYAEAKVLMPEQGSWIEDKGDYYIVRIPDGKTFARETLDKPTIFGFGRGSGLKGVRVNGFTNLYVQPGAKVDDYFFDARGFSMPSRKSVVQVDGQGFRIGSCNIYGPEAGIDCGIQVLPSKAQADEARPLGRPVLMTRWPA